MAKGFLRNTDFRCLLKFIYNLGIKSSIGLYRFKRRLKKGDFFPAFHFISITDDCNLQCQGCWVTGKKHNDKLSLEQLDLIIEQSKKKGSYFFGILGGEPLMYPKLFEVFEKHSDCYFQLFTNGTLLSSEKTEALRKLANVTPLISFEGDEEVADIRRGGDQVYLKAQKAIENSTKSGLITGVAMSVCKSNMNLALSDKFIESLSDQGVTYLWYYIYRPVGENPSVDLTLSLDEIQQLRLFMVEARTKHRIVIIDAYWDENGEGLCPAATGLSHHINASGNIEPCPIIQFSKDHINDDKLETIYRKSSFLSELKDEIPVKTKGCILMEDPKWLANYIELHQATDTSGRGNELSRLKSMEYVPSHGTGKAIPEKNWIYKFAKRKAFFGLGAYG